MQWGTMPSFSIGEKGRGRRGILLPTNVNKDSIDKGMNADLTIGLTKSGRPRVNKGTDNELYMILSSEGGYTRRGDGIIYMPTTVKNQIYVLAVGNGADGDAGRIGTWRCCVMKVPNDKDFLIRVRIAGSEAPTPNPKVWRGPLKAASSDA